MKKIAQLVNQFSNFGPHKADKAAYLIFYRINCQKSD